MANETEYTIDNLQAIANGLIVQADKLEAESMRLRSMSGKVAKEIERLEEVERARFRSLQQIKPEPESEADALLREVLGTPINHSGARSEGWGLDPTNGQWVRSNRVVPYEAHRIPTELLNHIRDYLRGRP